MKQRRNEETAGDWYEALVKYIHTLMQGVKICDDTNTTGKKKLQRKRKMGLNLDCSKDDLFDDTIYRTIS